MVLQRGEQNTFWWWTIPGETVRVEIGDRVATGVANLAGAGRRTSIRLPWALSV
jgi:hypothetical protein